MSPQETEAYNLVSALHTEAMLDNARLQQKLDDLASDWRRAFWYWLKSKLGINRDRYRI
jgi:hypothetical protein